MTLKTKLLLSSSVILIFIIALTVYILIPKSYITIELAPQRAFIKIDSKDKQIITNGDTLTINPGKHTLSIYRDEFSSHALTFDIKNGEKKELLVVLTALTEDAKSLLENDDSGRVIEKYTGVNMDNQVKQAKADYPILKILPVNTPYYNMYSCRSEKYPESYQKVAICITIDDLGFKSIAYDDIKYLGYNLDDYEVIWL